MTTARRTGNLPACPTLAWIGLGLTLFASFGPISLRAATTERVVVDRHTGLAIHGFDPVAYFTDATAATGREEFEYSFAGVVWRFVNPGNRAAFARHPDVYMPQFGGHDPVAVARGVAIPGHPQVWLVAGARLYLFQSAENRAAFASDPQPTVAAAQAKWPQLRHSLVP